MYNKLLKPPYQNWWWRRRGINGNGEIIADPALLSPVNHYTELTHVGGFWEDSITNADFELKSGVIESTVNGLDSWLCNGTQTSSLRNVTGTISFPWANTDQDLTFYFVMACDYIRTNAYAWQFQTSGIGSFFGFFANDKKLNFNFRDDSNNTCTGLSNVLVDDQVYVFAVKIKNVTGAATVDVWQDGVKLTQGTQSTFTAIDGDGLSGLFNLIGLNFACNGKQCEIAFFTVEHSDEQCVATSEFLMSKWGVS